MNQMKHYSYMKSTFMIYDAKEIRYMFVISLGLLAFILLFFYYLTGGARS